MFCSLLLCYLVGVIIVAREGLYLRHVELVVLFEELANGIDLQELGTTTSTDVATEIGNLVGKVDIALLAKHTDCSEEEVLGCDMLLL